MIAWFKKEFTGWDKAWLQLFEQASGPFIPHPQYCVPLDKVWEPLPNLTLIGDAAHVIPPYAGEGVNMAMLDALEFSGCLLGEEYKDVPSAIAAYERSMHKRFAEVGKQTMDHTEAMHSDIEIVALFYIVGDKLTGIQHYEDGKVRMRDREVITTAFEILFPC